MLNNKCSVNGCIDEARYKKIALCSKHYQRLKNNGDPEKLLISPKGNGSLDKDGYLRITVNGRRVKEHIIKAEIVLGRRLSGTEVVHHIDGNKLNNNNSNLVICKDAAYHHLLHLRTRAINNGHPASYRKCSFCKEYGNPDIMCKSSTHCFAHPHCRNKHHREYMRRIKSEQAL